MIAAVTGLTPDQFYSMTFREFECWLEGYERRQEGVMDIAAWVQANLINIHVPRGKQKVKPEDLKKKKPRKMRVGAPAEKSDAEIEVALEIEQAETPKERTKLIARRIRAREEHQEALRYFASPDGRRLMETLDRVYK